MGSLREEASQCALDSSGQYVYLAGETQSYGAGGWDALLVKYDTSGNQLWNRTWGGTSDDCAYSVAVDPTGPVYICDASCSGLSEDGFLVKYNDSGAQLWNHTWGGPLEDRFLNFAIDASGNVYAAGFTGTAANGWDAVLVKFDSSGNELWNRTWGGSRDDYWQGVAIDGSTGYVYVFGETLITNIGNRNAVIGKYDPSGTQLWVQTWGGSVGDTQVLDGAVDAGGNVYAVGQMTSSSAGTHAFLAKYTPSGDQLWSQAWGGSGSNIGYGIAIDAEQCPFITGFTTSFGASQNDAFIAKYNSTGTLLWNRLWGGPGNDYAYGIILDVAGNIYLAGITYSWGAGADDAFLAFIPRSEVEWDLTWGGAQDDTGYLALDPTGQFLYLDGMTKSFGEPNGDVYLAKFATNGTQIWNRTWGGPDRKSVV